MQTVTTNSFKETQKVAEKLVKTLKGGEVLCLYGDLGHGKTTFVQGLAKGLGVERRVNSPTFIIMRTYEKNIKHVSSHIKFLYHVDLYRINSEQDIIDLGLYDIMNKQDNIVVIEWPEKMGRALPEKRIDIKFEYIDEESRKISIS